MLLAAGDDARASFNSAATSLKQLQSSETTQLGDVVAQSTRPRRAWRASTSRSRAARSPGSTSNSARRPARPARETARAAHRRHDPERPEQPGHRDARRLNLVSANQSQALTLDTSGPTAVLRAAQGGFAANVTSGQAGGMLNDINTAIPSYLTQLDSVATTLRDQVNGVMSTISGTLAGRPRGPERGGHAAVRRRARRRRVQHRLGRRRRLVGSGRRGRAPDRAADRGRHRDRRRATRPRRSRPTPTARCRSRSRRPARTRCRCRRSGTNAGFATLLGNTPVGSDGIGGRAFFTGTDASTLRVSPLVAGNPAAVAAGAAGKRPARRQHRPAARRHGDLHDRRRLGVQHDDRAARRRTRRTCRPATTSSKQSVQSLDAARTSQAGVNIDEEMTNLVEFQQAYEASAKFITTIDSMLDTLINMVGP